MPAVWTSRLSTLFDRMPPRPWREVRKVTLEALQPCSPNLCQTLGSIEFAVPRNRPTMLSCVAER